MAWVDRCDLLPCCGDSPGAVADREEIARLIHSSIAPPGHEPFSREQFYPPKKRAIDNDCGNADGCSVTRTEFKTDVEVAALSIRLAGETREAKGALLADVAAIRAIRTDGSDEFVFRVYDDPNEDAGHAVIRAHPGLSRARFDDVRVRLHGAFSHILSAAGHRSIR